MHKLYGILSIVALLLLTHFLSFTPQRHYNAAEALRQVEAQFIDGLSELNQAIGRYQEAAARFQADASQLQALQQAHTDTRLAFKRVEFLLEYNDRESIKKYINGAPLLTTEPKVPEVRIIEPVGLQVLDELAFGESPAEEADEIVRLTNVLAKDFSTVRKYQSNVALQHRFVFEGFRYELIRMFTLGLTGFDTPGSVNAIPEAQAALEGSSRAILAYLPLLQGQQPELARQFSQTLKGTKAYLARHQDFEQFDRLAFLKEYLNPLFAQALDMQLALEVELEKETINTPLALNYEADNLFSPELLNANYYANLAEQDISEARIALGKLLFYDPILSENNERSCASCHNPDKAFTDGRAKSLAMNGEGHIQRNAPTLINSVYSEHYFYDLREPNLERQVKHVILDSKEFNTDFLNIIGKLQQSGEYRQLFAQAYPEHPNYQLSKWSISNALAAYIASLRSFDSPFDQYVRGEREQLSEAAQRGFNLFMGKASCGTCHFAPTFNGTVPPYFQESESEVLGVPASAHGPDSLTLDPDLGRFASAKPQDEAPFYVHSFKTVTVRNAALTAPYMHNGIYKTLEEVVEFYNRGGGAGMGIDVPYQTLPDAPLQLNEQEIADLVAFMESLTDTTGMTAVPQQLPAFEEQPEWNKRKVGGTY